MLLPASLADWGKLAKEVRERVAARLKPGAARRAFWEQLAERAFGAAPALDEIMAQERIISLVVQSAPRRLGM